HMRTANTITTASRLIFSNGVHLRHEQTVGHSLLKMSDHRSLRPRDRDRQRVARGRLELDNIGPVVLWAENHDPVFAVRCYRHFSLPQSSSVSRFTAAHAGFLNLSQSFDRPDR